MFGFLGGLFASLFGFLKCLILFLVGAIAWVLVTVFNSILAALMGLLSGLLALLPQVTLPSLSLGSAADQLNYFFPLDTLLVLLGIVLPIWLLLPVIKTGLRWLRFN